MPSTFDFQGKVAIVTGCASGIGESTTQLLLQSGCSVLGVDVGALKNEQLLAESKSPTASFAFHQADVVTQTAPDEIVAACTARFGPRIDVLANVAGIVDNFSNIETLADDMLDRVLDVNLKAPIRLTRAVVPKMTEGAAIVNVSSKAGMSGAVSGLAYATSKHGLIGVTKNTAWQLRYKKIRCNAVAPGGVMTNMRPRQEDMDIPGFMATKPVMDLMVNEQSPPLDAIDIANSIVFLASDLAMHINGAILPIDKGWSTM